MVEIDMQNSLEYNNGDEYDTLHQPATSQHDHPDSSQYNSTQPTHQNASSNFNDGTFTTADDFGQFVEDDEDGGPYPQLDDQNAITPYPVAIRQMPEEDKRQSVKSGDGKDASRDDNNNAKRKSIVSDSVETLVRRFKIFFPKQRQRAKSQQMATKDDPSASETPKTNLRNFSFASSKIGQQYDDYQMGSHDVITDLDDPMEYGNLGIGATEMGVYHQDQADPLYDTRDNVLSESDISGFDLPATESRPANYDWSMDDPISPATSNVFSSNDEIRNVYQRSNEATPQSNIVVSGALGSAPTSYDEPEEDYEHTDDNFKTVNEPAPNDYNENNDDIKNDDDELEDNVLNEEQIVITDHHNSNTSSIAPGIYNYNNANEPATNDYHNPNEPATNDYHISNEPANNDYHNANEPVASDYHNVNEPAASDYHNANEPVASDYHNANEDGANAQFNTEYPSSQENSELYFDSSDKPEFSKPNLKEDTSAKSTPTKSRSSAYLDDSQPLRVFKSPEVKQSEPSPDVGRKGVSGGGGGGLSDAIKRFSNYFSLKKEKEFSVGNDKNTKL